RLCYSAENPIADASKLYWMFFRTEQSGLWGIFITLLVYIMIFIISFSVLYLYFLRLHKESWVLDMFQRISCHEELFNIPYDLEISNQELSHIVRKSEQWRGINGERRK
ncbi:orofacial cleft 1 candidate gene 1, partial [Pelobates cultripes]